MTTLTNFFKIKKTVEIVQFNSGKYGVRIQKKLGFLSRTWFLSITSARLYSYKLEVNMLCQFISKEGAKRAYEEYEARITKETGPKFQLQHLFVVQVIKREL